MDVGVCISIGENLTKKGLRFDGQIGVGYLTSAE